MTNPFEDVEAALGKIIADQKSMVRQLDGLEVDVTPWEASFLDSVLKQLDTNRPLTQQQIEIVRRMADQYDVECDL